MINKRVEQLLRNPQSVVQQDLGILESEVRKYPYMQSVRALHLMATHRYNGPAYQKMLSQTAAFTTDKKILYQFINGTEAAAAITKPTETTAGPSAEAAAAPLHHFVIQDHPEPQSIEAPAAVFVEGERNRILFPGEENFLNEPVAQIDLQATQEAGVIVVNEMAMVKDAPEEQAQQVPNEQAPADESGLPAIAGSPEDDGELSFHQTEEFLPQINVKSKHTPEPQPAVSDRKLSRHQEEMQRLLAEVEAKMKQSKRGPAAAEPETQESHAISFANTPEFVVKQQDPASTVHAQLPDKKAWEPMSFDEPANVVQPAAEVRDHEPFKVPERDTTEETAESNIPLFINTWQNWLKLDKIHHSEPDRPAQQDTQQTEEAPENITEETAPVQTAKERLAEISHPSVPDKSSVIEKFITNEPKISRLNEDGSYAIRDRGDDISHLMTETLANLYIDQRLYIKALRAFEILKEKYPEKSRHFDGRIAEVKELRQFRP